MGVISRVWALTNQKGHWLEGFPLSLVLDGGVGRRTREVSAERALRGGRLRKHKFISTRREVVWYFNNLECLSVRVRKKYLFW